MYNSQTCPGECVSKKYVGFLNTIGSLIPARQPDQVIVNKNKEPLDHRVKIKETEKSDKYLDLARELKIRDSELSCNWRARTNPQRFDKDNGRLGNQRTSGEHPDKSILKIR